MANKPGKKRDKVFIAYKYVQEHFLSLWKLSLSIYCKSVVWYFKDARQY